MKRNIFFISVALLAILSSCQINVNTKKNDTDSEQKNTESVNDNQNATTVESTTPPPTAETKLLYGCVSDPDGYTNIRKSPSTDAPVVRRYESGEFLYFTPFNSLPRGLAPDIVIKGGGVIILSAFSCLLEFSYKKPTSFTDFAKC